MVNQILLADYKTKVIAHKCGYVEANAPENSFEALNYSIGKSYIDGVELDIQLTKDNELVVIHNKRVDKLSDGQGLVSQMTLSQLQNLNFNGSRIMTLEEALSIFPNDKQILIEIKRPLFGAKKVMDHYHELIKKYNDKDIMTICFIPDVLAYLKNKDKTMQTGILADMKQAYNLLNSNVDSISIEKSMLSKSLAKYILNKDKKLGIFTIKSKQEFDKAVGILGEDILEKYYDKISFTTSVPSIISSKNK